MIKGGGGGGTKEPLADELRALQAEAALLRERVALLEAAVEIIGDAVFVKDRAGRYTMINTAGARLVGKTKGEVLGKDDTELFAPETAQQLIAMDRGIIAKGAVETYEDVATAAGVTRAYEVTKGPYRDAQGQVVGVIGSARDVTERKRAEAALRETEEFLARLLDYTPAPIYVAGNDGRLRLVNRAWEEVVERSREQAVGRPIEQLFPPEQARRFLDQNRQVVETAAPLVLEEEFDAPGGRHYLHATVKFPLRDAAGRVEAVGGISFDMTERKQAEDVLARHALLLANVRDSVIVTDLEGIVTYWNEGATRLFGWRADEMLGRPLVERVPEPARARMADAASAIRDGTDFAGEWEDYRKDGSQVWIDARVTRINDAAGRPVGLMGLAHDITDRKRVEETLREYAERSQVLSRRVVEVQEEERRHLARELHDEIGQTLTAIGINLQAVKRSSSPPTLRRLEECIGIVDQAIQQVRHLSLDLRPSMLDDLGLVAALRWYVDSQAQRVGYKARFSAEPEEVGLGPATAIAAFRVAQEALTNVARHAGAGWVGVRLRLRGGTLRLSVRDDGAGFDPKATLRREAQGVGLGLLGMRERAALLGGHVEIRSAPGRGTLVQLTVPAEYGREGD